MTEPQPDNAFADLLDYNKELIGQLEEIFGASDRAGAIVAAAQVENELEGAISSRLPAFAPEQQGPVFEGANAPLHSFHAKIVLGRALGLFAEAARQDLAIIKDVRNTFAHQLSVRSFDAEPIKKLCGKLNYPPFAIARGFQSAWFDNPRDSFVRTATYLQQQLVFSRNKFFPPLKDGSVAGLLDYPVRAPVPSPKKARVRPTRRNDG